MGTGIAKEPCHHQLTMLQWRTTWNNSFHNMFFKETPLNEEKTLNRNRDKAIPVFFSLKKFF
jgi:hypothetical protein